MPRFIDLVGRRYNKLVVLEYKGTKNYNRIWLCQCDCGNTTEVTTHAITSERTRSCGCLRFELEGRKPTHGLTRDKNGKITKIYSLWNSMKNRCYNPDNISYKYYGKKGIKVCDEWLDSKTFITWAMQNGWQPGLAIDRIDSSDDYKPLNCRFITKSKNSSRVGGRHTGRFSSAIIK